MSAIQRVDMTTGSTLGKQLFLLDEHGGLWVFAFLTKKILLNESNQVTIQE